MVVAKKFQTTLTVRFRDADPAQVMFFGNLFDFAHDIFEQFIMAAGYKYQQWFSRGAYMVMVRHAEADFRAPFRPGTTFDVIVSVAQIRQTSFQMRYVFAKEGKVHGQVLMVHAVLDSSTQEKAALPPLMRERLTAYLDAGAATP